MKAKHCVAAVVIASLLLPTLWAVVQAADRPRGSIPRLVNAQHEWDTLRGLQGVHVVVEGLAPEVERLGLTQGQLRTDIELQLRQSGIKVLTEEGRLKSAGRPWLYVRTNVLGANEERSDPLAVGLEVKLQQAVFLERNHAMRCTATTWQTGKIAMISRTLVHRVRDHTKDMVAEFIKDYLAANPKQHGPTQKDRGSEAKQG